MIYFQAICKEHGWESSLFLDRANAARSAAAHRNSFPAGTLHEMIILEKYIPKEYIQIQSETVYK